MTESLINEWLADCADYSQNELHTFASTLSEDNEIVRALYALLEERSKNSELVDTVCNQLFDFYRSREIELQRFTLQFVPSLIFIYLNSVAHGDIKNCRSVETLLIGLYNLEVVDKSGENKAVSFRLPSLAMLSIYHEPSSLAPASLTESAVRRFEECNSKLVRWGPLQQVETLNAQNRLKIMTALLFVFNQQLSFIKKLALEQLCKVSSKLVTQGFSKPGLHQRSSYSSETSFVPRLLPRIPVSNQFILELLQGIYFSMYNDCWYTGCQAVEDIHNRICYDGFPDVMLVTNAIRNSINSGPSGQPGDSSMGVGVALSPATATPTISKSMITNASFRTKKLPDDIPIVEKEEGAADGKANLVSITEEHETADPARVGSIRQNRDSKTGSKITNFSLTKKPKEKDGKTSKNGYVGANEKESKKSATNQTATKDNIKGSKAMLNSDENDTNTGINLNKKRNDSETNSIIDCERHLSTDGNDTVELDNPGLVNRHQDQEQIVSSVQVSSV